MTKEDIPHLNLTYVMHSKVQTLNESGIYYMNILTQHDMALNMF